MVTPGWGEIFLRGIGAWAITLSLPAQSTNPRKTDFKAVSLFDRLQHLGVSGGLAS